MDNPALERNVLHVNSELDDDRDPTADESELAGEEPDMPGSVEEALIRRRIWRDRDDGDRDDRDHLVDD